MPLPRLLATVVQSAVVFPSRLYFTTTPSAPSMRLFIASFLLLSVLLLTSVPVSSHSLPTSLSSLRRLLTARPTEDAAAGSEEPPTPWLDESRSLSIPAGASLPVASVPRAAVTFPSLLLSSNGSGNFTHCGLCELVTSYIAPFVLDGGTMQFIEDAAFAYCMLVEYNKDCHSVSECSDLCSGIISEFGPIVLNIVANTSLSAQSLCFDISLCPPPTAPIPGVPVPSNVSDMSGQKQWPMWRSTSGSGSFLHMSDLHFDRLYSAGSSTECGLDLCCRAAWTVPGNTSGVAGMFGDYNCDSPAVLVHSVLDFVNATLTPRPDFILYTGDDPAHDVWHQNRTTNLAAIAWVSAVLLRYFPDIPVFSAVGNHEAAPVNQFGGPGIDSWLYESLVLDWAYYLPHDAQQTLNYGGYYAALVRPGLYVLSINTNIYTGDDYYTKYEMIDVSNQLAWLNDTMAQIEQLQSTRCIVIGHSSPVDWYDVFADKFNALLSRYQHIVLNTFFGHTHHNQVQLYSDDTASPAHTVGYIGGSVTPYTNVNPGVAVYSYDRALQQPYLVADISYYWLNLTLANQQLSADWEGVKAQASRDYGLSSLSPAQWWKLTEAMIAGGADEEYHAMQSVWYKGLYGGGRASLKERQCFACSIESDTESQMAECSARSGAECGEAVQLQERQQADKCGSYTVEQMEAMRGKAAALERRKAVLERPAAGVSENRFAGHEHRHTRRG